MQIRLMDVIKQHFGVGTVKIEYYGQMLVLGVLSENVFSLQCCQKNSPNYENP